MANQIAISPEMMEQRAREYQTEAGNMERVISKMDGLLGNLQQEWQGVASASFVDRYGELRENFVKAQNLIEEIAVALKTTASNVQQLDEDMASQYRG